MGWFDFFPFHNAFRDISANVFMQFIGTAYRRPETLFWGVVRICRRVWTRRCKCHRITVYRMCMYAGCIRFYPITVYQLQQEGAYIPFLQIASCIWSYIGTDFKLLIPWTVLIIFCCIQLEERRGRIGKHLTTWHLCSHDCFLCLSMCVFWPG